MKKHLLLLVMMLLPLMASAEAVEIDGIYYNLINKGKIAEVTRDSYGYSGSVIIPETVTYNGTEYRVTSIGYMAFSNCSRLNSITIPKSVTSIGIEAFYGCMGLTSVNISDIAAWCAISFGEHSNPLIYARHLYLNGEEIKSLIIPDGVTSIGTWSFVNCTGLTSITFPNSVTTIGNDAFDGCAGLTSVTIPNSVTSIGYYAFLDCTSLTYINIPNSVTSIGHHAFAGCTGLTSITIPDGVTSIANYIFSGCNSLTSVTIPNSVTYIGDGVFWNSNGLTSVTIGSGIKIIEAKAFASCPELTDVYCYAENVPNTQTSAFEGSYVEYATLHVPAASINTYKEKEPWKNFKNIVSINMPEHTLSYIVDGETYKKYQLEEGTSISPEPVPTKEGYTFSG